jgi:phage antirepressor YoqD-like protein
MEIKNDNRKLNLTQGASVLGISPHTLRSWTRQRKVIFYRCGRKIIFAIGDLEKFLSDHRVEARK